MKKTIYLLLIWCGTLAVGCSSDSEPTAELSIVKADVNIPATGGESTIEYKAVHSVSVAVSDAWCKASDNGNGQVLLSVEPNTAYEGRSTQVTITSGTEEQSLIVAQAGAVFIYDESELVQHVTNEGGTVVSTARGSFPCEASIPEGDKDWISYVASEDGKGGSFVVKKNDSGNKRSASVTVKSGARSCVYTIFQYDVENLLGTYSGQYYSYLDGKTYALRNIVVAESDEEGYYTINGLLGASVDLPIKATYKDGAFSFSAGQQFPVNIAGRNYTLVLGLMNDNGQTTVSPDNSAGLSPVYLEGTAGNFALGFSDNGGLTGTFAGIHFVIYYNGTSLGDYEIMLRCMLYRV